MPKKDQRIRRAYRFFCDAERRSLGFSLQDIAQATGWSLSTVGSYRTKKWHFLLREDGGKYYCSGATDLSEDAFVRLHAQRVPLVGDLLRPRISPTVDALIDKAREASLLAVQIYNNPLLKLRAAGYIVQMVIAFTALYHAVFERDGVKYWHTDKDGNPILIDGDEKTWELLTCTKHYYEGGTSAVTENLRLLVGLRNKIEHRSLPTMDMLISGFCQAALMNFEELLVNEFGDYFSLGRGLSLALQLTAYSTELDSAMRSIQANQYEAVRQYIEDFSQPLPDDIVQSPRFSFRAFLVPKIGSHASSSDIAIEFIPYDARNANDVDKVEKHVALIKQKRVEVADSDQFRPSSVIEKVEEQTGVRLRDWDHIQAWKYYGVRSIPGNPEDCDPLYCHYNEAFDQITYTQKWIDFLSERVRDPEELGRIRSFRA